ncbi:hypothetical protein ACFZCK_22770 [Kitasatospora purpeofusca]|uniref:hypothetical protein n=1 Tax=Kitasatospora purpeofusca TaxID=67352 RepID=UPI0036EE870F
MQTTGSATNQAPVTAATPSCAMVVSAESLGRPGGGRRRSAAARMHLGAVQEVM